LTAYCGANPDTRLAVRIITEVAWQAHFVKNMFIKPERGRAEDLQAGLRRDERCQVHQPENWKEQGLNSENFVAFNMTEKMQLIGGTWYGGEMKKGMFSMMNYFLPLQGHRLHALLRQRGQGRQDVAIFFGLSGTGKTTLSTDPEASARSATTSTAGTTTACSTSKGAATPRPSSSPKEAEPDIYNAIRATPCWRT
jgi:phosphoenolpyruvate carboxykinase (ATP)